MKTNDTAGLAEFMKYEIAFPFFRDERYGYDSGWRIGVRDRGTDYASADAMGALLIETLAIVSPGGKYGPRVFYIQTWRGPDGEEFGTRALSCDSVTSVAKKLLGFKGAYELVPPPAPSPPQPQPAGLRLVPR